MSEKVKGRILWWGRGDKKYSRNRIVLDFMNELGFKVDFFHPRSSWFGKIEALFSRIEKPDFLWVPCFRQSDVFSASFFAKKWKIPLVFDPLISAYQKEIFERQKWPEQSFKAKRRKKWETKVFSNPDIIVCDTQAHANYFRQTFSVPEEKLSLLFVGAEEDVFLTNPSHKRKAKNSFEILFYGSFIELQGAEYIGRAAKLARDLPFKWVFVGEGPCLSKVKEETAGLGNVVFKPWMSYDELCKQIFNADILLGVFGDTSKADMVIPNKVYQAMAAGKPVITRMARAYDGNIAGSPVIGWVPKGDSQALFNKICKWLDKPELLLERGAQTRQLFDGYFGTDKLLLMMETIFRGADKKQQA